MLSRQIEAIHDLNTDIASDLLVALLPIGTNMSISAGRMQRIQFLYYFLMRNILVLLLNKGKQGLCQ